MDSSTLIGPYALADARAEEAAKGPTVEALALLSEWLGDDECAVPVVCVSEGACLVYRTRDLLDRAALTPTPPPPAATVERCAFWYAITQSRCGVSRKRHDYHPSAKRHPFAAPEPK
jgi:hypothetical protein